MANRDGGGSQTFGGLRWTAEGMVAAVAVALVSPGQSARTPSLGVPLTILVSNTGGTNSDIQIVVASDAAFTSVVWPGSLSNQINGVYTVQPTGLVVDALYYWRARAAPTGTTTWGPWSEIRTFAVDLNVGKAWGYSYENVGVEVGIWSAAAADTVYENVGVEITLYAGEINYSYENVGVEVTLTSQAVEYVYEGDVNDLTPIPHVWFAYKKYGFVNDQILIYGQGFGALQSQYNAQPALDWGPDFTKPDIQLGAQNWVIQPSTADSFGPNRRIYAGSNDFDPPFSNVETDIFTITVPASGLPTEVQGPQNDFIYVVTTGGTSNKVAFLFYPTIPVLMAIPLLAMHSVAVMQVVADPVADGRIAQPLIRITAVPYLVAGGMAQRDPLLGAISKTSAQLGV